jgi:serine/threonine protein phosphatase PrpC
MTVIQEQWLKVWLDKQTLSNGIDAKELLAELAALPEIQDALEQCEQQLHHHWLALEQRQIAQVNLPVATETVQQQGREIHLTEAEVLNAELMNCEEAENVQPLELNSNMTDTFIDEVAANTEVLDSEHTVVGELKPAEIAIGATQSTSVLSPLAEPESECMPVEKVLPSDELMMHQQNVVPTEAHQCIDAALTKAERTDVSTPALPVSPNEKNSQDASLTTDTPQPSPSESVNAMPTIIPQKPQATAVNQHAYRVVLPNAREGEAYSAAVLLELMPRDSVISKVEFEPDCGLYWDAQTGMCMGTPNINGNVNVKVWWHLSHAANPQHELVQTTLYVNADPKSLWRNIPSDTNTLFWKSDDATGSIAGEYDAIAARVRGRSHAHVGSCCDDDFAIEYINGEFPAYIAIVADGAGSAAFSRLGSKLAVEAACKTLSAVLQSEASVQFLQKQTQLDVEDEAWQGYVQRLLSRAAYNAYMEHHEAVKQHEGVIEDVKQLSTTLIIGMSVKLPNDKWLIGAYWIGDGAIAIYRPQESVVNIMGESDSGEFSGQTCFLSKDEIGSERLYARIVHQIVEGEHALILMTDGVSDPKFDSEQALLHQQPWSELWQEWQALGTQAQDEQQMAQLLQQWLGFWSQGNHDDRTLVIVSPPLYSRKQTTEEAVQS